MKNVLGSKRKFATAALLFAALLVALLMVSDERALGRTSNKDGADRCARFRGDAPDPELHRAAARVGDVRGEFGEVRDNRIVQIEQALGLRERRRSRGEACPPTASRSSTSSFP